MKFKQMTNSLKVGLILNIIFCALLILYSILKITVWIEDVQTLEEKIKYYALLYSLITCPIALILTILYMTSVIKNKKIVGIVTIFATAIPGIIILVAKVKDEEI